MTHRARHVTRWLAVGALGAAGYVAAVPTTAMAADNGGWLGPVQVSTTPFSTFRPNTDNVAIDAAGRITVAWVGTDVQTGDYVVQARRSDAAGTWGDTQTVGTSTDQAIVRAVVVDGTGTVTIVYGVPGAAHALRARQWAGDGSWGDLHSFDTAAFSAVVGVGPSGDVLVLVAGSRDAYLLPEGGLWQAAPLPGHRPRGGKAVAWGPGGHPTAIWWVPRSGLVKAAGWVPATQSWATPRTLGEFADVEQLLAASNSAGAIVVATLTVEDGVVVARTARRPPAAAWGDLQVLHRFGQELGYLGLTVADGGDVAVSATTASQTVNRALTLWESTDLTNTWSPSTVVLDDVYVLAFLAGNDNGDLALSTTAGTPSPGTAGPVVLRRGAGDDAFGPVQSLTPQETGAVGPVDVNASGEVAAVGYADHNIWVTSYLLP